MAGILQFPTDRKLKGFTQERLAETIDKNLAFIGSVEAPNINRTISLDTLFDIADVLEVPAHKFLDFNDLLRIYAAVGVAMSGTFRPCASVCRRGKYKVAS